MDRIAQQQLDAREKKISSIRTRADADQRSREVRAKLLELIGGLPEPRTPLNARVVSSVKNSAYTMERLYFESMPHYYVTAVLYRPNEAGRYPGVLLSAGHTTLGKTESHRMAANLAAKGFVALTYDPLGLG